MKENNDVNGEVEVKFKPENEIKDDRMGMALGVISGRTVPFKWMMHMQQLHKTLPAGIFWTYVYDVAKFSSKHNYASARTSVVKKCKEMNVKWLLFIDSDVFIPNDGIARLFSHDKDIVTGVYWKKKFPAEPVIFKNLGDGPIWKIEPSDELLEIGGAGLGCTLVKMSVFDKFDEAGIPYFNQDWTYTKGTRTIHVDVGEDHWFFDKARELGFKVYCDTNVLCDHYDVEKDLMFPGEEVVNSIAAKELAKMGREDIVDKITYFKNVDPNKKTIVFFNAQNVEFNGNSINEKALAGSESSLIRMAREIKKLGWNVQVFCNCDRPGQYDGVLYRKYEEINTALSEITSKTHKEIDVFVSSRDIRPFTAGFIPAKKKIMWCHDLPKEELKDEFIKIIPKVDYFFMLSEFQTQTYQQIHDNKIPNEKIFITKNGIDPTEFIMKEGQTKQRGRCMFASAPVKGLDVLMEVWPKIKEKVPKAELHIFGGMGIWNLDETPETKKLFDYAEEHKNDLDIYIHKCASRKELVQSYLDSDVLIYPNTFAETSCISAMEAIQAKMAIVSSKFGALPETIKLSDGVLIPNTNPYKEEYQNKFIDEAVKMLTDDKYRESFNQKPRDLSWASIAKEWDKLFDDKLVLIKTKETNEGKIDCNTKEYWDMKYKKKIEVNHLVTLGIEKRNEFLSKIIPKDAKVLDIGCGTGELIKYLYDKRIGSELYGVDISSIAIEQAKKETPLADFDVISEEPQKLKYQDMDIIICSHTMEHLQNPEKYINEWKKSLAKGGEMILVIPLNDKEYHEHLKIWTLNKIDDFVKGLSKNYFISVRNQGWIYKDEDRLAEEAIVRIVFDEMED